MDEAEFRRRIEVYMENDLGDLAADRKRVAEVLAGRLWPLVHGWRADRDVARQELAVLATRFREECPEAFARLSVERTGSDTGWP